MVKHWAAWPPRIRWLAGVAAVVLGLAFVWVLFVPVADWLAHHDVGSATGPLHETALDNSRGRLLTLGAAGESRADEVRVAEIRAGEVRARGCRAGTRRCGGKSGNG